MKDVREKFLTIGELSKLTGSNIKSLRYYEKIGILKPVYVEPSTKYRYYSPRQDGLVLAIQLCLELDIPLKKFQTFLSGNKREIHYMELIEYGKHLAAEKIKVINDRMRAIGEMQREILRSDKVSGARGAVCCDMPEKSIFVSPYEGSAMDSHYFTQLRKLYGEFLARGYNIGFEVGLMRNVTDGVASNYIYAELLGDYFITDDKIRKIPEGDYLCLKSETPDIAGAEILFPEQYRDKESCYFITELFTGDYNYVNPKYEVRVKLQN